MSNPLTTQQTASLKKYLRKGGGVIRESQELNEVLAEVRRDLAHYYYEEETGSVAN